MKEKSANAGAGDTVELADKDTGFYDPETQFKIVREQTGKLGDTIGTKTNRAILSGQLLVVEKPRKQLGKKEETDGN